MQDKKPGSSRRAVMTGALALTGAPFIRRASAQPAACRNWVPVGDELVTMLSFFDPQ